MVHNHILVEKTPLVGIPLTQMETFQQQQLQTNQKHLLHFIGNYLLNYDNYSIKSLNWMKTCKLIKRINK